MQYPLGEHEKEKITSRTGKKLTDITLDEVMKNRVSADDIKISKEVLKAQGQVAREAGNDPMEKNFERAAELVDVPDDVILKMYDKLRPNRSTKLELVLMAQELLEKYNARNCAPVSYTHLDVYKRQRNPFRSIFMASVNGSSSSSTSWVTEPLVTRTFTIPLQQSHLPRYLGQSRQ